MKKYLVSKKFLIFALLWSCITNAAEPLYSDLRMKDYDEMQTQVRELIQSAEEVEDADIAESKSKLKDALRLIFSRPNGDNMVSQLIPAVRTPLRNIDAYETTIKEVADKALQDAKNDKLSGAQIATALFVLNNILSELKPEIKNKTVKEIFANIRDAEIEIHKKVASELRMRSGMKTPESPSKVAEKIIGKSDK